MVQIAIKRTIRAVFRRKTLDLVEMLSSGAVDLSDLAILRALERVREAILASGVASDLELLHLLALRRLVKAVSSEVGCDESRVLEVLREKR